MAQFTRSAPAQAVDLYDRAVQQTMNMSSTTLGGLSKGLQSMSDLSYDATYAVSPTLADLVGEHFGPAAIGSSIAQGAGRVAGSNIPGIGGALATAGNLAGGQDPMASVLHGIGVAGGTVLSGGHPLGGIVVGEIANKLSEILGFARTPEEQAAVLKERVSLANERSANLNMPAPPSVAIQAGIDKAATAEKPYAPEFDWGFGGQDVGGTTDPGFGAGMTTAPTDFSDIPSDYGQDDPSGDDPGYSDDPGDYGIP